MCQNCSELVSIIDGGEYSTEDNDLPIGRYPGVPGYLLMSNLIAPEIEPHIVTF